MMMRRMTTMTNNRLIMMMTTTSMMMMAMVVVVVMMMMMMMSIRTGNTHDNQVAKICRTEPPAPEIYRTDVMYIRYYYGFQYRHDAFRLLFSFHSVCCT